VSSVLIDHPDDTTLVLDVTVAPATPAGGVKVEVRNAGTGPGAGTGSTDLCGCLAVP
jgi:hypothetical protein